MLGLTWCLLMLGSASLYARRQLKRMRRARAEIERRRSQRSRCAVSTWRTAIGSACAPVRLRLTCDAAPVIEGIHRALAALDIRHIRNVVSDE